MKEFFDQLRAEAEQHELPQPAELRVRAERRAARRGAAGAFSLAVLLAGGFIVARPLFHTDPHSQTHAGALPEEIPTVSPLTRAVPNVIGMSPSEATSALMKEGFKVQVVNEAPADAKDPQAGKVRQQDPAGAQRIPGQTTVTIWVNQPPAKPVCADKYPKQLPTTLFVNTDNEICYADTDPATTSEPLPVPCPPSSASFVEDRRGFHGIFTEEDPTGGPEPTELYQTITKYDGTGAKDYLTELAKDVGKCEPVKRGGVRLTYTMATQEQQERLGEQSLLINVESRPLEKPETGPEISHFLILVVRAGPHVIVVYDKGWEGAPSKRATILDTARTIVGRLTTSSPAPAR
ncbi:MAG TPA: PASTA domain-containing protein [Candidatus Limnocylindrales bacterium]